MKPAIKTIVAESGLMESTVRQHYSWVQRSCNTHAKHALDELVKAQMENQMAAMRGESRMLSISELVLRLKNELQ